MPGEKISDEDLVPLIRSPSNRTINSRSILAGFYGKGKNSKRILHNVECGALQMPKCAVDVIENFTKSTGVKPFTKYDLPGLDSIRRPTVDPTIKNILVTELMIEKVSVPQVEQATAAPELGGVSGGVPAPPKKIFIKKSRCVAKNRLIRRVPSSKSGTKSLNLGAERIRGGGDWDVNSAAEKQQQGQQTDQVVNMDIDVDQTSLSLTGMETNQISTTENSNDQDDQTPKSVVESLVRSKIASEGNVQVDTNTTLDDGDANIDQMDACNTDHKQSYQEASNTTIAKPGESHVSSGGKDISFLQALNTNIKAAESNKSSGNDATGVSEMLADTAEVSTGGEDTLTAGVVSKNPLGGKDISALKKKQLVATTESITSTEKTGKKVSSGGGKDFASLQASNATMRNCESNNKMTENKEPADALLNPSKLSISSTAEGITGPSNDKIPFGTTSSCAIGTVSDPKTTTTTDPPQIESLTSKPVSQWKQHIPAPNDETTTSLDQLPPKPEWYRKNHIDEIERTMLSEWFDSSAPHRTPTSYLKVRETVIEMSDSLSNRNVTNAMIRRTILGDAGSLYRLRSFLEHWGIINNDGINDSAPTPSSVRGLKRSATFNGEIKNDLILAVTQQAKRLKMREDNDDKNFISSTVSSFDWEEVAASVGHGVSAEDCQRNFMTTSFNEASSSRSMHAVLPESSITSTKLERNESKGISQNEFITSLVRSSDPQVLKKTLDAALEATSNNLSDSQTSTLFGLLAANTVEDTLARETDLANRLTKLLDTRMEKLENRMTMIDDVEAILEAEKIALEMERRDLYTARCRHWFGGS